MQVIEGFVVAGFLVFLGLILFMFRAGYEWRRLETREQHEATIDSLIQKI